MPLELRRGSSTNDSPPFPMLQVSVTPFENVMRHRPTGKPSPGRSAAPSANGSPAPDSELTMRRVAARQVRVCRILSSFYKGRQNARTSRLPRAGLAFCHRCVTTGCDRRFRAHRPWEPLPCRPSDPTTRPVILTAPPGRSAQSVYAVTWHPPSARREMPPRARAPCLGS
jgi:hypothetical protein